MTVNADRSIIVKPGDWLSKYTMAIWGEISKPHIAAFKRKVNGVMSRIDNPDLIHVGEKLYVMCHLPGEIGIFPGEDKPGGSLPSPRNNVNNGLLEVAAGHFDAAIKMDGPAMTKHIALGLMRFARGLKDCSHSPAELECAALNFGMATRESGEMQVHYIALGLSQCAYGLMNCTSEPEYLETAKGNFDWAMTESGRMQWHLVALGLHYFAYGLRSFSSAPGRMQQAARHFNDAVPLDGSPQIKRIALGLWNFALGLRT